MDGSFYPLSTEEAAVRGPCDPVPKPCLLCSLPVGAGAGPRGSLGTREVMA